MFVLDSSGSIGLGNFQTVLTFASNVVEYFDVGKNKVRVGVVVFSASAHVEFDLVKYDSKVNVQTAIKSIVYPKGGMYVLVESHSKIHSFPGENQHFMSQLSRH